MPADTPLDEVRKAASRVAADIGLEVLDVQLRREAPGWVLRVIIDRPVRRDETGQVLVEPIDAGIGIAECQRVSEDLGAILDVEDTIEQSYTLEVSSPGLDRPLRGADDYRRFAGRLAKIVVSEPVDGQMHFEGRLVGLEGDRVRLEAGRGKLKEIPLARIARARLEVEF